MTPGRDSTRAHVGDLVIVEGHRVGEARRIGEILEVLGEAGHEHYRVRWDDDHKGLLSLQRLDDPEGRAAGRREDREGANAGRTVLGVRLPDEAFKTVSRDLCAVNIVRSELQIALRWPPRVGYGFSVC